MVYKFFSFFIPMPNKHTINQKWIFGYFFRFTIVIYLSVPGATISKSQFSGIMYCLYLKKKYWLVYWIEIVGFFFKYNKIIDYISLLLISNQPNNYKPLLEDFLNVLLLAFFKIYINIVVFVHFHNMSLFRCDINMTYTYDIKPTSVSFHFEAFQNCR